MPSALRKWQSFLQGRMDLCLCVVWLKHPASLLLWRIPNPRQAQHVPCGGQSRRQLCWASYWKVRHMAAVPGRDLWGALTLLCPPCKQGLKRGLMWNPVACASQQLFVRPDLQSTLEWWIPPVWGQRWNRALCKGCCSTLTFAPGVT